MCREFSVRFGYWVVGAKICLVIHMYAKEPFDMAEEANLLDIRTNNGDLRHDPQGHGWTPRVFLTTHLCQVQAADHAQAGREDLKKQPGNSAPPQHPNQLITRICTVSACCVVD